MKKVGGHLNIILMTTTRVSWDPSRVSIRAPTERERERKRGVGCCCGHVGNRRPQKKDTELERCYVFRESRSDKSCPL